MLAMNLAISIASRVFFISVSHHDYYLLYMIVIITLMSDKKSD